MVVGAPVSFLLYSLILAAAIAVTFGVRRNHLVRGLTALSHRLHYEGARLKPEQPAHVVRVSPLSEALHRPVSVSHGGGATTLVMPTEAQAQRIKTHHIVRIRANLDNLSPSLRAAAETAPTPKSASAPLPTHEPPTNFDAIGTVKGKPSKGGPMTVERPDGRIKRYFTVSGMREPKAQPRRALGLPSLNLLRDIELNLPDEREINHNVVLIENTLLEFDIDVEVVDVRVGPTVTQYAVQPFRETSKPRAKSRFSRTRVNKIASLASDLALALCRQALRMRNARARPYLHRHRSARTARRASSRCAR